MAPIVIAYHLIWTNYGSWLPNDPRGSGSSTVKSDCLKSLGEAHLGRKRIQPPGREIRAFYDQATPRLQHAAHQFTRDEIALVASTFAQTIEIEKYTCYACAIMPDHVHILIRKHKHDAEQIIENLRASSRLRLSTLPRFHQHPVWTSGHGWQVFLDHPNYIIRTIGYIEKNPSGMKLPPQEWGFVKPYDRWPLHPGHSQNSPYVKRLKAAGRYP